MTSRSSSTKYDVPITLDDATYSYPSSSDPQFQEKITRLKEYRELRMPRELQPRPRHGEFYNQQIFTARFLQTHDYLIINQDPGTGKTGSGILTGEMLRRGSSLTPVDAYKEGLCNWVRSMKIFTPSATVDVPWQSSFAKHTDSPIMPLFYTLHHYEEFYNKYGNAPKEAALYLSHSMVWCDEFQAMINRSEHEQERRNRYSFFKEVFANAVNIKLVLASGTLLVISSLELAYLVNLLPRPELKMPEDVAWHEALQILGHNDAKTTNWSRRADVLRTLNINKADAITRGVDAALFPYVNGVFSYLRSRQRYSKLVWPAGAKPVVSDGPSFYHIITVPMSTLHAEAYRKAASKDPQFNQGALKSSVFGLTINNMTREKITHKDLINYGEAIVIAVDIAARNPLKPTFVVSHWLNHGILPLRVAFELAGYTDLEKEVIRAKGKTPVYPSKPGRRYAVLKAGSDPKPTAAGRNNRSHGGNFNIIDYFNMPRNIDGEYLQIVLASEVGTTAISLFGVELLFIMDPALQLQQDIQRRERVFRATGHEAKYARNIARGMTPEDAKVAVEVYYFSMEDNHGDKDTRSATFNKYYDNIMQDRLLDPIRNSCYRIAVDAQLFIERNQIRGESVEYGFYGVDMRNASEERQSYEIVYGDVKEEELSRDLIATLVARGAVNVDDFVKDYARRRDVGIEQLYRRLAKFAMNARLVTTANGERVFIHLDSASGVVYASPEKFTTPAGNTLTVYTAPHRAMMLDSIISTPQTLPFDTWEDFELYLDATVNDVQNKQLKNRIKHIEQVLILGPTHSFYENILRKYPRSIRVLNKPVDRILQLSKIAKGRRKVASQIEIAHETIGSENVVVHVLRAQRDIQRNAGYTTFVHHTTAALLHLLDNERHVFVHLLPDSPEQLSYAKIMTRDIMGHYEEWVSQYITYTKGLMKIPEVKLDVEQLRSVAMRDLYGIYFRPENVFRIFDNRGREVMYSAKNEINKARVARTKKHFSFNVENFLDIMTYLHIEDKLILYADPEDPGQSDEDRLEEFRYAVEKITSEYSYEQIRALILEQAGVDITVIVEDDNMTPRPDIADIESLDIGRSSKKESAITSLLVARKAYYSSHLERFATFYLLYLDKDHHGLASKDAHSELIESYLTSRNRVYNFV